MQSVQEIFFVDLNLQFALAYLFYYYQKKLREIIYFFQNVW